MEVFELYPAIKALDALNTLIWYSVSRWMDWFCFDTKNEIMSSDELVNRLKPYIEILRKELINSKNEIGDKYTTLVFAPDWNNHWKCEKCWNMQSFNSYCLSCWRKSITMANGQNNFDLIK